MLDEDTHTCSDRHTINQFSRTLRLLIKILYESEEIYQINLAFKKDSPSVNVFSMQMVEWASCYKYLGLVIDNKMHFDSHVETVCKKGQQWLHCLQRLSTSNISRILMTRYYKSYIESVLSFSICCSYSNVNVKHRNSSKWHCQSR